MSDPVNPQSARDERRGQNCRDKSDRTKGSHRLQQDFRRQDVRGEPIDLPEQIARDEHGSRLGVNGELSLTFLVYGAERIPSTHPMVRPKTKSARLRYASWRVCRIRKESATSARRKTEAPVQVPTNFQCMIALRVERRLLAGATVALYGGVSYCSCRRLLRMISTIIPPVPSNLKRPTKPLNRPSRT